MTMFKSKTSDGGGNPPPRCGARRDDAAQAPTTLHDSDRPGGLRKSCGESGPPMSIWSARCQTSDFRPATTNDHLLFFLQHYLHTDSKQQPARTDWPALG